MGLWFYVSGSRFTNISSLLLLVTNYGYDASRNLREPYTSASDTRRCVVTETEMSEVWGETRPLPIAADWFCVQMNSDVVLFSVVSLLLEGALTRLYPLTETVTVRNLKFVKLLSVMESFILHQSGSLWSWYVMESFILHKSGNKRLSPNVWLGVYWVF